MLSFINKQNDNSSYEKEQRNSMYTKFYSKYGLILFLFLISLSESLIQIPLQSMGIFILTLVGIWFGPYVLNHRTVESSAGSGDGKNTQVLSSALPLEGPVCHQTFWQGVLWCCMRVTAVRQQPGRDPALVWSVSLLYSPPGEKQH